MDSERKAVLRALALSDGNYAPQLVSPSKSWEDLEGGRHGDEAVQDLCDLGFCVISTEIGDDGHRTGRRIAYATQRADQACERRGISREIVNA